MSQTDTDSAGLPRKRLRQPTTAKWFLAVFGVSLVYAIVRYHVVGTVSWAHFPLFILNKVVSLAAVGFLACSYLVGRVFRWHSSDKVMQLVVVKFCGLMGLSLAAIHAFMSLCLLRPSYFSKYFAADGRLNLEGELAMATGVVALWFLVSPAIATIPMMPKALGGKRWKRAQRMGYVALTLVIGHLVILGFRGWMTPEKWSGLPPISLIAVVVAILPVAIKVKEIVANRDRKTNS
jgi:DMSO/TMAO reductase YedYZ heme-binding membrane subunit